MNRYGTIRFFRVRLRVTLLHSEQYTLVYTSEVGENIHIMLIKNINLLNEKKNLCRLQYRAGQR